MGASLLFRRADLHGPVSRFKMGETNRTSHLVQFVDCVLFAVTLNSFSGLNFEVPLHA